MEKWLLAILLVSLCYGQVIEAETGVLTSPMTSSGGFVQTHTRNAGSVEFNINIDEEGYYYLKAKILSPDPIGAHDSFFVGLESENPYNKEFYIYDTARINMLVWDDVSIRGSGNHTYAEFDPYVWKLEPGTYTFIFYGREEDAGLDAIELVKASCIDATFGQVMTMIQEWRDGNKELYDLMNIINRWINSPCPIECGDGICKGEETCSSCETDCGTCPVVCGDGNCNGAETCLSCQDDCGPCQVICGDGTCDAGETSSTCSYDCGTSQGFTHPGLLNNMAELNLIKTKVTAKAEPWYSGYQALASYTYLDYTPAAMEVFVDRAVWDIDINPDRYTTMRDSSAAYGLALQWVATGDTRYAQKAVEILNDYAYTLKDIKTEMVSASTGHYTSYRLYTSANFPAMIYAAEIMRSTYSGWSQADQDQFKWMAVNVIYPHTQFVDPDHTWTMYQSNWAALGTACRMAVAIYADRQDYFDQAVSDFKTLLDISYVPSGRYMETCRGDSTGLDYLGGGDMAHTQMALNGMVKTAEMAKKQGVDLYSYVVPGEGYSLLSALDYHAPFIGYPDRPSSSNVNWPCQRPLEDSSTKPFHMSWEMVNNQYRNSKIESVVLELDRPEEGHLLGWGTLTHNYNE